MSTLAFVDSNDERLEGRPQPSCHRHGLAAVVVAIVCLVVVSCPLQSRSRGQLLAVGEELEEEVTELALGGRKFCEVYPYFQFQVPNAVMHNNLGNKGPAYRTGEGIQYLATALGQGAGPLLHKDVWITVNATNSDFQPAYPKVIGMQGKYASVNIKPGTHLDFTIRFYDGTTGQRVSLNNYSLTLFDLDTGHAGASREYVELSGFVRYHLTKNTEVKVSKNGQKTHFAASTEGTGADNPTDPMFLTDQQKNRAVTAMYEGVDEVNVRVGAEPGATARFFTLVHRPSLLCAITVSLGFQPPLPNLIYKPPMQAPVMGKFRDKFVAWRVKVGDHVKKGQPIAVSQAPGQPEHVYLAQCDGTVMAIQDKLKPGDKIKERLDDKALAVIQRPYLSPLPQGNDVIGGGPGKVHGYDHDTFQRYLVKPGEVVKPGQPIAEVKDNDGNLKKLTATEWGVVKARQEGMKKGDPMARVKDKELITLGKLTPLPKTATIAGADVTQVSTPLSFPFDSSSNNAQPASMDGATFEKYNVKPGDVVKSGDPIATVKDRNGKEHVIVAPRPGVVKAIQTGLKPGMPLKKMLKDNSIATIGPLPSLNTSESVKGSYGPLTGKWMFEEWKVKVGDDVKSNQTVAVLKHSHTGELRNVTSQRSGTVTARMDELQVGDIVEDSTKDEDLVTVGKIKPPKVGFRKQAVGAKMDDIFKEWKVKNGERVHMGDPIAVVTRKAPAAGKGGRRLSGPQDITIPSPGTGTIDWKADLQPGESIRNQSVGPTIARLDLGLPWWLALLAALLALCCCFCCLYKVMQKPKPVYKPMPPVETKPEPEPAPPPPPPPKPQPKPDGLRLDFNDNGTIRTVYAKYRPLGIKHNYVAPIVAHDFTVNSYAKQELGVKDSWKLTRIADEELNEDSNFDRVNNKLSGYMKDFPLWPLPLEFRKTVSDASTHVIKFVERPIGLEFSNVAPIQVGKIYPDSPAARQGVEVGWFLTRIGEFDVHENHNFREVMKYFKEGVQPLDDSGKAYTEDNSKKY
mmetsp:Transcript_91654/g.285673  ORF Transcript_91654/g.285673 Transcript_91654/m.285673 type:complete len:1022 (-) Transcript_91654:447-3512(-)